MARPLVLNWCTRDPRMVKGLKKLFDRNARRNYFVTIRLGPKWADKLTPGQRVAISTTEELPAEAEPKTIGHAIVLSVEKNWLISISPQDLRSNIGARTLEQALIDMQEIYGQSKVDVRSVVSVIRLVVSA